MIVWMLVAAIAWMAWLYPFVFRAPHRQRRPSVTLASPTRVGLLLQVIGIAIAFRSRGQIDTAPGVIPIVVATALAAVAVWMGWTSVASLGRQFRISAGLYEDHELVRTGPYRYVRHPIYSSMLAMLVCSILLLRTSLVWTAVSLAIYIVGTEIRVRAEDGLLASRFGASFAAYRRSVSAYIPFVR